MEMLPDARLYIDGKLRAAAGNRTFDNICPWTGDVIGKSADASADDVNDAIAAARRAFDQTDWSQQHEERFALMKKYRDLLFANRDRLVQIVRLEAGSSIGAAYRAQVDRALSGMDDVVTCFPSVTWEEDRGLKPAPDTPATAAFMGELAVEAGFPPGVFNVITSADPVMAGEALVKDPRVDVISFTGSTGVGKRIMETAAATLKRVFLELGGKSANIILDDAPDFAMSVMQSMVISHTGQGCAIPTRLLVPRSRYDEAVKALEMAYAGFATKWGDFDDPTQVMGPVISARQRDRVMEYIALGQKEGARLLAGGKARTDKGGGFFIEPTCLVDVRNDMRIAQEEIFGPVLVVIPYEDDEDAIRIANDSDCVISASKERATRIARRMRAGAISVNGGLSITGDLPFGGFKCSGVGREWGREGIEEFLDSKVIATRA